LTKDQYFYATLVIFNEERVRIIKRINICLLVIIFIASMASTSYAAPKDYATLQWYADIINVESSQPQGKVRITVTGVVGTQLGNGAVDIAGIPDAYYYTGPWNGPSVGVPEDYENKGNTSFWVHSNHSNDAESIIAPKDKLAQAILDFAAKNSYEKVDVKLIPIVEGATMKIELVDCPALFYYQFHYPAFSGTQPLLLTEVVRRKAFFFEMWADENPVETRTFKKIVDEDGTFRVYPFPVEANVDEHKAFYVVTEAEAKALKGKSGISVQKPIIWALPTSSKVLVDGTDVSFEAYSINGYNYFKLRDLAKVLSGSEKQFQVGWDGVANAIQLTSNKGYTTVGGELVLSGNTQNKSAAANTSKLYLDGKAISLTAYTIGGNNYFKLRDVGKTFNFGVDWDSELQTIAIITANGYTE
jgi:hypothetical protein